MIFFIRKQTFWELAREWFVGSRLSVYEHYIAPRAKCTLCEMNK